MNGTDSISRCACDICLCFYRLVAASGADAKSMVYTSRAAALGSVVPIKGMLKRKITELEREQRKSNRVDKRLNAPTKQDPTKQEV